MRLLLLLLFCISFNFGYSQLSKFQHEYGNSFNYIYHHGCTLDDKSYHRGYSTGIFYKANYQLKKFRIITGLTFENIISNHRKFPFYITLPATVQYDFGSIGAFRKISYFTELGVQYYPFNNAVFIAPLLIGSRIFISKKTDCLVRLKIPAISLLTDNIGSFYFVQYGIDISIAHRFYKSGTKKKRKKYKGAFPCDIF